MSPENQWLEDVFPTEIVPVSGDMLVFRGVSPGWCFLKNPRTGLSLFCQFRRQVPQVRPPYELFLESRKIARKKKLNTDMIVYDIASFIKFMQFMDVYAWLSYSFDRLISS